MNLRTNWLLLINAALGSFLAGTASRIFAVSMPTVASSLETTIVGDFLGRDRVSDLANQFVVGLRTYRRHLRPANSFGSSGFFVGNLALYLDSNLRE
jgi:hypothetical protein